MSISDLTNLYPDGIPFGDSPQWPWTPAVKWNEPNARPTHDVPVLAYVRYNDDGKLFPAILSVRDDENRRWTWDGEEDVEWDGLYSVLCWFQIPTPPEFKEGG